MESLNEPKDRLLDAAPKKKKKKGSTRAIETFYRCAYRTQLDLTGLADMKANIMISINGLIITAIIATEGLLTYTQYYLKFLPTALLIVCIMSLIFAMLSVKPRVSNLHITADDMLTGKSSLLYFNNFIYINEEQYAQAVANTIEDIDDVYCMMSKHIYNLGVVLSRKYFLLRISYSIFLGGIILIGLMFVGRSII